MYQLISRNPGAKLLLYQNKNQISLLKLRAISSSPINHQSENAQQSTPPKSRSGLKLVALALTGFTIGIGYATLNPDSRRQIESIVPQSSHLFTYIDQLLGENKNLLQFGEKKTSDVRPIVPTEVKRSEPKNPEPVLSTKSNLQTPREEKKVEKEVDKDWKHVVNQLHLQEEATVNAVETKLNHLDQTVKLKVSEALNSSYVAIESLNKYRLALRRALDDTKIDGLDKDLEWRQVTDLFDLQSNDVNAANEKFLIAKSNVQELDKLLGQVKQNEELRKNVKNVKQTQIDLINQMRSLQVEENKLNEAIAHANVLKSYTQEQKVARNQFLKEMQSLQPEGIRAQTSSDQLSNEEINSLLLHAHKRVVQLQNQLEKLQKEQNKKIQAALEEQRNQNLKFIKEHDSGLYQLHRKEFELELEKILEEKSQKFQEELKKELSRQAAAHNNHLAQMLRIQQDELNSLYEKRLLIENEKTRTSFYQMVSDSLGRLMGIEKSLHARANLELQANNAKQLWLAVQNLSQIIQSKAEDLNEPGNLVSIKSNFDKIQQSAPNNEFIQRILATVSAHALSNGIWSEPDLKDRFQRLRDVCNKVALIDDRGGSLFKYFISYLQSFVIIHPKIDKSKLDESSGVLKLEEPLSTFNILDYAEYYLESGNVEYALRLMQQLKGEPKRLARDWIKDACLLLEIKQACSLLNAYISSVYIGTNLK
ncbi:MICOS complex subunit MIC60 isoform X5 [Brachionus plicatilis]|uniref:MICOS complex subunit MIC60 n=1 Tax=Brachionus plicatilis TaxID=10195 RepID=A0A3M7SJB5_BRAPC|nr:MICOS complex subunit MIC60 isoform X5 [Brachionus plicatilis]